MTPITGYLIAGALLLAVTTGLTGYWRGFVAGQNAAVATHTSHQVKALESSLASYQKKLQQAHRKTRHERNKAAIREAQYEKTTHQLQQQLAAAKKRHACLSWPVPAEFMQHLRHAREDAANAATGGVHAALPSTGDVAGQHHGG